MTHLAKIQGQEGKYNVLVVDDEPSVRRFIEFILKELKYNIYQAATGDEALEILKDTNMDLVIMDLLLPGKHGLNICGQIREMEKYRKVPILVMTAVYTKSKYNYTSKEYGADAFIIKPFDVDDFINMVNKLLHSGNTRKSPEMSNN